jgi:HEAT repeat protein
MDFLDKGTQEAGVAARCLGRARHTEATGGLLLLLNSTVLAQKKAALEALREMGAEVMVAEVEKQLLHETPEIRQAAAGVLRHLRGGEEGEAMEALREDYYKRVRHGVGNI